MSNFFIDLPKIELHAHLNASLSEDTVKALISQTENFGIPQDETFIGKESTRTFKNSFEMFKLTQRLTSTYEAVKFATKAVIGEFAADGVCYLELRSTPRSNKNTGLTKKLYVDAVLEAIQEFSEEHLDLIEVRYLLSIDRRLGVVEAEDTLNLAVEYQALPDSRVLGIDFSGDATVGDARDYIHIFEKAKDSGLKLAIHMAEVRGLDEESLALLSLPPNRIGHGTFLHENEKCKELILKNKIPLETCLTSNVKCETVPSTSRKHHHLYKWNDMGHPVIVCTDGKGAFDTTLSQEYQIAASECGMSRNETFEFSRAAIDHVFAADDVKSMLQTKWNQWRNLNLHYFTE